MYATRTMDIIRLELIDILANTVYYHVYLNEAYVGFIASSNHARKEIKRAIIKYTGLGEVVPYEFIWPNDN
jgi:hypothetical protein